MSSPNSTSTYSPSSEVISICRTLGKLNDPSKATSTSLDASLFSIITTALTFPFAAFLNALILVAFYKNSSLRKQANVFLMALALTNFIRAVLASPFLMAKDVLYQKKLEPSCFVTVFLWNVSLFTQGELLLTAINCERFIGLRYPIWHRVHVTKVRLVKVAVACCILGFCLNLVRSFTEKARIPVVFLFFCSAFITFTFAVLIWRYIKKRNKEIRPEACSGQAPQTAAGSSSRPNKESQSPLETVHEVSRLGVPTERDVNVSNFSTPKKEKLLNTAKGQSHLVKTESEEKGHNDHGHYTLRNICWISISEIESDKNMERQGNLTAEGNNCQQHRKVSHNSDLHSQNVRNVNLTKSERKAALLATYLAIGLLFTRFLPFVCLALVAVNMDLMYAIAPFMQTVRLMTSLVEPMILLSTNQDIRKVCLKLIKC